MVLGIQTKQFAQVQNITITSNANPDQSVDFYYEKKQPGSYYLSLEFSNISNCNIQNYKTIVSNYSGRLLKLTPIDKNQGINYSFQYYYIIGKPNPKIDTEFQYILPFKNGKKIRINEATNLGEIYFGSEKPKNWKNYIVNSESPDTLYSMRKGVVVQLVNQYDASSSSELHYTSNRNSITIEHADGTFAIYEGLKKNSILVKLGQTVYPQTQLGIMEVFNTNNYRASFSIYFLYDKDFKFKQNQTLKNYKSEYEYITPNFVTQEGILKVESGKEYTSIYNEAALFQELTNSEKKKYLKNTLF
ncbi:hypothetical protein B0E44_12100 [Flavobacterium sp. A45]|nr:hypothetical protein B0E44_12100 [Flavobacterium sp. A45]